MPPLGILSRAAVAAFLLALAACNSRSAANGVAAPDPGNGTGADQNMAVPDIYATEAPAPTMAAPRDEPDAGGPRNAFIVCPGNPRCPPAGGTKPGADQPD